MAVGQTDSRSHQESAGHANGFDFLDDPAPTSIPGDNSSAQGSRPLNIVPPSRSYGSHFRTHSAMSGRSIASAISNSDTRFLGTTQDAFRPGTPTKHGTRASTAFYAVSPNYSAHGVHLGHVRDHSDSVRSINTEQYYNPNQPLNRPVTNFNSGSASDLASPDSESSTPPSTQSFVHYSAFDTSNDSAIASSPPKPRHQSRDTGTPAGRPSSPLKQVTTRSMPRRPNWENFEHTPPPDANTQHQLDIGSYAHGRNTHSPQMDDSRLETNHEHNHGAQPQAHTRSKNRVSMLVPPKLEGAQEVAHSPVLESSQSVGESTTRSLAHAGSMDNATATSASSDAWATTSGPDPTSDSAAPGQGATASSALAGSPSKTNKLAKSCAKCNKPITGQFVRALGGAYHLACFTCEDCGKPCAAKFFAMESQTNPSVRFPLCEHCYFSRLDLLCYKCGEALRGPYITALDRKYHIEHFTCSVCPLVFGTEDSYYEYNSDVFCHFHYWTLYAARCEGCRTAILKQFVETYRGGKDHRWHPECYMIFKFWNVKLGSDVPPGPALPSIHHGNNGAVSTGDGSLMEHPDRAHLALLAGPGGQNSSQVSLNAVKNGGVVSQEERDAITNRENYVEGLVLSIWTTLCGFEEAAASCISSMLQCAVTNNYNEAFVATSRLVSYIQVLFRALDRIGHSAGIPRLGKEPKTLCRKIVSYMSLVSKTRQSRSAMTPEQSNELLTVASSLAHYLKVLIRYGLSSALAKDRHDSQENGDVLTSHPTLRRFLDLVDQQRSPPEPVAVSALTSDRCLLCEKPVEDKCMRCRDHLWHINCFSCVNCQRPLVKDLDNAVYFDLKLRCRACYATAFPALPFAQNPGADVSFTRMTRLDQYVLLLNVAIARLELVLGQYAARDSAAAREGTELTSVSTPALLRPVMNPILPSHSRRSSENIGDTTIGSLGSDSQRVRSKTDGSATQPALAFAQAHAKAQELAEAQNKLIETPRGSVQSGAALERTSDMLHSKTALTLDDIRRIVAAEQAREQMPNAFRHKKAVDDMLTVPDTLKVESDHGLYFGNLTNVEHRLVQQIANSFLVQLLAPKYVNATDLVDLIDSNKQPTIWEKFGKAFGGQKKRAGVFGVPLEVLIERVGVESTLGVGSYTLRVPSFVDDCLTSMKQKDMSVEGIFRKNGNIRRIREFSDTIDKSSTDTSTLLAEENSIQLAALLKKFLRDMPAPLMGSKLSPLWILVTKVDTSEREHLVQLLISMLSRPNRDLLEVLVYFLNWVASFAHLDDEAGSRMDAHNLATVITPNIFAGGEGEPDTYLQAIEAVNLLIEQHTLVSRVPSQVQVVFEQVRARQEREKLSQKDVSDLIASLTRT